MPSIVADSCCDLTKEDAKLLGIEYVPFKMSIKDKEFVDDDNFDFDDFINSMQASDETIKTSCPSPYDFFKAFDARKGDDIFCITISKKLSGTYQSAIIGAKEYKDKYPNAKIHIFDSKSASAGESNLAYFLHEKIQEGKDFDSIVCLADKYIEEMKTFFVLESLDNLLKNGRIKKTTGLLLNVLNIKPAMTDNDGEIELFKMKRGFKSALVAIAKHVELANTKDKILSIVHVDALDKANFLKSKLEENCSFKKINIIHSKGLASAYGDNGGIILAY
ncbi:EDD domain protein, DegV family [Clostridiales bacterium KA00134]|nr:EDD domain protein, DegV family [Clostridiales bacterium KA00134]